MKDIRYERHFLTEVIARLDFATPVEALRDNFPNALRQVCLSQFPIEEPNRLMMAQVNLTAKDVSKTESSTTEWTFHDKLRRTTATFSTDSMHIVTRAYTSFEQLSGYFNSLHQAFTTIHPGVTYRRLGLRYVNVIDIGPSDPFDWTSLIAPSLLTPLTFRSPRTDLLRGFTILDYALADFQLRFQYGLHNPDFPAPLRKRNFVLDFDAHREELLTREQVPSLLSDAHDAVQTLFESCITEELRSVMHAK